MQPVSSHFIFFFCSLRLFPKSDDRHFPSQSGCNCNSGRGPRGTDYETFPLVRTWRSSPNRCAYNMPDWFLLVILVSSPSRINPHRAFSRELLRTGPHPLLSFSLHWLLLELSLSLSLSLWLFPSPFPLWFFAIEARPAFADTLNVYWFLVYDGLSLSLSL